MTDVEASTHASTNSASPAGPDAIDRVLRAFWVGLSTRSVVTTAGIVGFALLEILLFCAFAKPAYLAHLEPRTLMRNENDDYARVTILASRLRTQPTNELSVVYLGASNAHRALLDSWDPRPIERMLSRTLSEDVRFWSLYTAGQTFDESLVLIEQIPDSFRGVVTLMVYDDKDDVRSRLIARHGDPNIPERLAVEAPELHDHLLGVNGTAFDGRELSHTGVYFLDHLGFFAARREVLMTLGSTWVQRQRGGGPFRYPPRPGAEEAMYRRYLANPRSLVRQHLGILRRILRRLREREIPSVLVEGPSNPVFQAMKGQEHADYVEFIGKFASRFGAEYWDLSDEARIGRNDFEDGVHLAAPEARLRFQRAFCDRLAEKLQNLPARGHAHEHDAADAGDDGNDDDP